MGGWVGGWMDGLIDLLIDDCFHKKENENVFKHGGDVVCQKCDVKLKSLWCNACEQPIRFHRVKCEDKVQNLQTVSYDNKLTFLFLS